MSKNINYFAYCANMLSNRMECCVHKSVKRKAIAKLEGYKVVYGGFSNEWYGTLPTIIKDANSVVWGSLWEFEECHKKVLDELQGVNLGIYKPITVKIKSLQFAGSLEALTYELAKQPAPPKMKYGIILKRYRPSKIYQEQLLEGAMEACLPSYYRKMLAKIKHNGYTGSVLPRWDDEND